MNIPHIPGGYVLLARKMLDSNIMNRPPHYLKLWVWMLTRARWKDGEKLARGQFLTSIAEMQEAMSYQVGWRKVTPTRAEIRSAYEAFVKNTMITIRKSTRAMVITICNYDDYQNPSNYESHSESHGAKSAGNAVTTQDREEREENKRIPSLSHCSSDDYDEDICCGVAHRLVEQEQVTPFDFVLARFVDGYPMTGFSRKLVLTALRAIIKNEEQAYQLDAAFSKYISQLARKHGLDFLFEEIPHNLYMSIEDFLGVWSDYIPDDWPEQWAVMQYNVGEGSIPPGWRLNGEGPDIIKDNQYTTPL